MRGQGQVGITTSYTSEPIRAEKALGAMATEAHWTREDLFMEVLQKKLELWAALNPEDSPEPGWGGWGGILSLLN